MSSREIDDGLNLSLQLKCPSQKSPQHKPSVNGIVFQSSSASRPNTVLDMNGIGRRTEREETRSEQHSASSEGADGSDDSAARKKLRLTKEQTELLEETFNLQNTLTQNQKVVLAKQLDLQTRQVEVWFQNRRARTRFKKTEVDCAYLKRACQELTDENQRLIKEAADLKAIKFSHLATPVTSHNMCPQCERMFSPPSATGTSNQHHVSESGPQDQNTPKGGDWLFRKFRGE